MEVAGGAGGASGERIEVEPDVLIRAGKAVAALGEQLGKLSDALGAALGSGIASGTDPPGLDFGLKYGRQAQQFADTVAQAANAYKSVGYLLEATGYNYKNADAASTIGGPGPTGRLGPQPSKTTAAHAATGPNSRTVPPPGKWYLVEPFLALLPGVGMAAAAAMTWPNGDSGTMQLTAAQWRNFGSGFALFDDQMAAVKTAVSGQHIPEAAKIGEALTSLGQAVTSLSEMASTVAKSVEDFAKGVQETQDAIRRLLNRISLGGAWDTIKGVLSGDGERVLREVAHDIGVVLKNLQRLVKSCVGLLDDLVDLLNDAADAFEKWVRPALISVFGDKIGGELADLVTLDVDIAVGLTTGLIGTVSGLVSMADPDTWKGMAELAASVAKDPSTLPGVLENMGKAFVGWDKWSGDHPGRAAGEAAFNIGSLFVPGGALSKTGNIAKGAKIAKGLLEEGKLGKLGELTGLGSKTSKLDELDHLGDLSGPGSKVPDVQDFKPGALPESPDAPRAPTLTDPSPSPHDVEGPHDPPGPDHTPAKGGGGGDGPKEEPGPANTGPSRPDGPTGQSTSGPGHATDPPHSGEGPSAAPQPNESPAAGHPPAAEPPSTETPHSSESPTHPTGLGEERDPSAHEQPSAHESSAQHDSPSAHDTGGHSSNETGHGDHMTPEGRGAGDHTPSETHSPAGHQPAQDQHTPDSAHDTSAQPTENTPEQPRPSDSTGGQHDSGAPSNAGMPPGMQGPGAGHGSTSHGPSGDHAASGKTDRPEGTPRRGDTTSPTERPRERPSGAGPGRDHDPSPPVNPTAKRGESQTEERARQGSEAQSGHRSTEHSPTNSAARNAQHDEQAHATTNQPRPEMTDAQSRTAEHPSHRDSDSTHDGHIPQDGQIRDYDSNGHTIPTDQLAHPHADLLNQGLLDAATSNPNRLTEALLPGAPSTHPEVQAMVPSNYDPLGGRSPEDWNREYWPSGDRDAHGNPELVWPDKEAHPQGFSAPEDRTPTVLAPGAMFDRFGPGFGQFGSPVGTAFPDRALPPHSLDAGYHRYEVIRPVPIWQGPIAPAMGQLGGGIQYYFSHAIVDLVSAGYLREVPL